MRGLSLDTNQATGSAGDGVWRKRLLGRLNDIDFHDFVQGVGIKTDFAGSEKAADTAPKPFLAGAAALPAAPDVRDPRALSEVSGEVIAAWDKVEGQREKLILAQQTASQLARRSRASLLTAGIAGLAGVGAIVGVAGLQILSHDGAQTAASALVSDGDRGPRVAAGDDAAAATDGWALRFSQVARPLSQRSMAMQQAQSATRQAKVGRGSNADRDQVAELIRREAQDGGSSSRTKEQPALVEPSKLSFEVALNGDGERTATLPLRFNGAGDEDANNLVVVRNMPVGSSLSSGVRMRSGEWALRLDEIDDLQVFLPNDTVPVIDLDLRVMRPNGQLVARTEIAIRTETVPVATGDVVASVIAPATEAVLGQAGVVIAKVPVQDTAAVPATKPAQARVVTAAAKAQPPVARAKSELPKSEAHASLPRATQAAAIEPDPRLRRPATAAVAAKKVDDYWALGADFAKKQQKLKADGEIANASAKTQPAATAPPLSFGFSPKAQPDWMTNQTSK